MTAAARLASLPSISRRILALAVLVLMCAVVWTMLIWPVRALVSSQDGWRQRTSEAIAEDRGMLELADSLRKAQEALKSSPLPARLYSSGEGVGPDLQLQEDLRNALMQSGVEPTNFKVLPAAAFRSLRAHRVEFASIMTADQLQAFLVTLDGQLRYVRIERLQLSAPSTQRPDENPRLNVSMEARGYTSDANAKPAVRVVNAN